MLKKEFIAGMVTGAIAFGGTGAAAAGLLAQPSMQSIYVNGQPVYCTAYAISGNNYVRLRDIGQAVGFDVSYDAATDSVQIRTGAQQAVQPTVAVLPTAATVSQRTAEAPAQPAVTPKSQSSGRDYSQNANPAIFTADLPREFYNSARHAYLNAEEMEAAFDRDLRKADTSLPIFLPDGATVTAKMKNVCSELGGVFYNYEITENSPYVYTFPRTDADLKWPYVQEIIETAKRYDTDRKKAEYLAETICDRLEYAYDRNIDSWSRAMENGGKAVCSGYSAAFQRMGRAAGLDVLTVGSAAGNHAWNLVYCDGEWLTVDLTHYDTSHNEANWFQPEHPKMKPDSLDEINFVKFCKEKSALFIVLPEEDQTKYFMVSLIIQNLYREILTVADEYGGRLPNRAVFFADELGTCPPIQSLELMFSASRSRGLMLVPIVQSITGQLQKNYGKEGSEIIVDNCAVNIFGGFAPASQTAIELSKALGNRTVMSGSISKGKNDPTQSLQMIERPLMTPDELKTMPKGSFVIMKTGVHPMQVQLRLFLDWGIRFKKPYEVPEKAQRKVAYANKDELEAAILRKHPPAVPTRSERPQPPLREERAPLPRRPIFRERPGDDL